ncbi:MAG: FeoA family protein [Gloeomargarita sp. HHBFW_bins_162]
MTNFSDNQMQSLVLSQVPVGERVKIVALACDEANARLLGMGLAPGVEVEVISHLPSGSVVVAYGQQRVGLGAAMAQRIEVTQVAHAEVSKLRTAAVGSTLRVVGYETTAADYKRKLLAMGLTPGTILRVKRHAPLGDPTEIEVRGFALSLRKAEADALRVQSVPGGQL